MQRFLIGLIYLVLSGCDYPVPLAGEPDIPVDERAVGRWERVRQDGTSEELLILPLDDKEYVLSWPAGSSRELFARAYLFNHSGETLVQLEWIGTSEGKVPDDGVVYQIAAYNLTEDTLAIRLLNPAVTGKDFDTTGELAGSIDANHDNPGLFREAITFVKTSP